MISASIIVQHVGNGSATALHVYGSYTLRFRAPLV